MSQPKAPKEVDPSRRDPDDDPNFYADAPLLDPSGMKGDIPENPDHAPGTIITSASGAAREIMMPDGTPASGDRIIQKPGGRDATPDAPIDRATIAVPTAQPVLTEEEALQELEAHPERGQVLSNKGWVTRDRLHKVTTTTESRSGIAELTVRTEGGTTTVDKAPS